MIWAKTERGDFRWSDGICFTWAGWYTNLCRVKGGRREGTLFLVPSFLRYRFRRLVL